MTVAKATGDAIPKTAIATAIASSKLLDAAVNESEADNNTPGDLEHRDGDGRTGPDAEQRGEVRD